MDTLWIQYFPLKKMFSAIIKLFTSVNGEKCNSYIRPSTKMLQNYKNGEKKIAISNKFAADFNGTLQDRRIAAIACRHRILFNMFLRGYGMGYG